MTGNYKKLFGATVLGLAFAAPAQADVITFEGYAGPVTDSQGWNEAGYNVGFYANDSSATEDTLVGQFVDGDVSSCDSSLVCPPNRYGTYYAALDDTYLYIAPNDGAVRVQVNSFDASFIGGTSTLGSYPNPPGLIRIQGFLSNGGSVTETYRLNGATATGFDFGHFDATADFSSNLFTAVAIFAFACDASGNCSAFATDRGQFAIDNIQLTDVPEPASLAIVGLGLMGLTAARRRTS